MFTLLNESYDNVIKSIVLTVVTDYDFALKKLVPLIDKLEFQRSPLRRSFYNRLEQDIINGCIMPFLTIAINKDWDKTDSFIGKEFELKELIETAFVLDGIQRLSTLQRVSRAEKLDITRPVFLSILICSSMDRLLYRMVTLNNGQKPMTARHQIEILAANIFDFDNIEIIAVSEKQAKNANYYSNDNMMNKENLIKAYIAYISNSINIDNQKIIESKMDELLTDQIIESNITSRDSQYHDVLSFVNKCLKIEPLKAWYSVPNNFIGFSAAMSTSFDTIKNVDCEKIEEAIELFESAFDSIDVSKIRLGLARRKMVKYFFENYEKFSKMSTSLLLNNISMEL